MKQTWQASARPEAWRTVPVPSALRWWWGLFLASNLISQLSFRLTMMGDTMSMMQASTVFDVIAAALSVPLNLVFIRIVRDLGRMQQTVDAFGAGGRAPIEPPLSFEGEPAPQA